MNSDPTDTAPDGHSTYTQVQGQATGLHAPRPQATELRVSPSPFEQRVSEDALAPRDNGDDLWADAERDEY